MSGVSEYGGEGRQTAEDDTVELAHGMEECAPCRTRRGSVEGLQHEERTLRAQPGSVLHTFFRPLIISRPPLAYLAHKRPPH